MFAMFSRGPSWRRPVFGDKIFAGVAVFEFRCVKTRATNVAKTHLYEIANILREFEPLSMKPTFVKSYMQILFVSARPVHDKDRHWRERAGCFQLLVPAVYAARIADLDATGAIHEIDELVARVS